MEEINNPGGLIYGVDTTKSVSPVLVRDAIVDCFTKAHAEELWDSKNNRKMSEGDFEEMKQTKIKELIKEIFSKIGEDFENPTKDSLVKVINELANFAKNFRDKKVVAGNYHKILTLIGLIK